MHKHFSVPGAHTLLHEHRLIAFAEDKETPRTPAPEAATPEARAEKSLSEHMAQLDPKGEDRKQLETMVTDFLKNDGTIDAQEVMQVRTLAERALKQLPGIKTMSVEKYDALMRQFPKDNDAMIQLAIARNFLTPRGMQEAIRASTRTPSAAAPSKDGASSPVFSRKAAELRSAKTEASHTELDDVDNARMRIIEMNKERARIMQQYNMNVSSAMRSAPRGQGAAIKRQMYEELKVHLQGLRGEFGDPVTNYWSRRKAYEARTGTSYASTELPQLLAAESAVRDQARGMQMDRDYAVESERRKYGANAPRWMWDPDYNASEGGMTPALARAIRMRGGGNGPMNHRMFEQQRNRVKYLGDLAYRPAVTSNDIAFASHLRRSQVDYLSSSARYAVINEKNLPRMRYNSKTGKYDDYSADYRLLKYGEVDRDGFRIASRTGGGAYDSYVRDTLRGSGHNPRVQDRLNSVYGVQHERALREDYNDLANSDDPNVQKEYIRIMRKLGDKELRSGTIDNIDMINTRTELDALRKNRGKTVVNAKKTSPFAPRTNEVQRSTLSLSPADQPAYPPPINSAPEGYYEKENQKIEAMVNKGALDTYLQQRFRTNMKSIEVKSVQGVSGNQALISVEGWNKNNFHLSTPITIKRIEDGRWVFFDGNDRQFPAGIRGGEFNKDSVAKIIERRFQVKADSEQPEAIAAADVPSVPAPTAPVAPATPQREPALAEARSSAPTAPSPAPLVAPTPAVPNINLAPIPPNLEAPQLPPVSPEPAPSFDAPSLPGAPRPPARE